MKEIELLEKLVKVQEMHIELMQDYRRLQNYYQDLEEDKNRRIEWQSGEIGALGVENEELKKQIADLKKQYEELQKLIPIELVGKEEENQ